MKFLSSHCKEIWHTPKSYARAYFASGSRHRPEAVLSLRNGTFSFTTAVAQQGMANGSKWTTRMKSSSVMQIGTTSSNKGCARRSMDTSNMMAARSQLISTSLVGSQRFFKIGWPRVSVESYRRVSADVASRSQYLSTVF